MKLIIVMQTVSSFSFSPGMYTGCGHEGNQINLLPNTAGNLWHACMASMIQADFIDRWKSLSWVKSQWHMRMCLFPPLPSCPSAPPNLPLDAQWESGQNLGTWFYKGFWRLDWNGCLCTQEVGTCGGVVQCSKSLSTFPSLQSHMCFFVVAGPVSI